MVPTVKDRVRTRLQKAFQEAESAKFLDQLYQNNMIESPTLKDGCVGQTDAVEEEGIFNDGVGPLVYTYEARLKPIPFPDLLVEHCKKLPPIPENPVTKGPACPAPPRNYKDLIRRQELEFEQMHSALNQNQEEALKVFTDDQINILDKIRKAISQGDPFKGTASSETTKEETDSDGQASDFEKDSD